MAENEYFKEALSNFMFDAASGGAIRHLADRGYTAEEILKKLDFPTPLDRIQKTIWQHFLDKKVVLLEEPGLGGKQESYEYVTEYDQYGRKSFRRVTTSVREEAPVLWRETCYDPAADGKLLEILTARCRENGEDTAYISCDFGLRSRREPEHFRQVMELLEPRQRQYILGIPWERRMAWHRLDQRMREITAVLYEQGEYHGTCYFVNLKEKMTIKSCR